MGEKSKIEWCDHTFNPWTGCTKIAPGCANCYAETRRARYGFDEWGPGKPRKRTSATYWKQPLKWNREAEKAGKRAKVFCASLADVFDPEAPFEWRDDLFALIRQTPYLDWLLLTKRPENALDWLREEYQGYTLRGDPDYSNPPYPNLWLGVSIANQADADRNIPILLKVPSAIRFISAEPLIGPVSVPGFNAVTSWCPICKAIVPDDLVNMHRHAGVDLMAEFDITKHCVGVNAMLNWVIVGGESGPGARPCDVAWIRSIVQQCKAADVPCFVKQVGSNVIDRNDVGWDATTHRYTDDPENGDLAGKPVQPEAWPDHVIAEDRVEHDIHGYRDEWQGADVRVRLDGKGGNPEDWPQDLRVREFPAVNHENTKAKKGA